MRRAADSKSKDLLVLWSQRKIPLQARVGACAILCGIFFEYSHSDDRSQVIDWFRQAASQLPPAIRHNPRHERRIPRAENLSTDGRVAQLAEQLTLNQ